MPSWGVSPFNLHIIGPQMQKKKVLLVAKQRSLFLHRFDSSVLTRLWRHALCLDLDQLRKERRSAYKVNYKMTQWWNIELNQSSVSWCVLNDSGKGRKIYKIIWTQKYLLSCFMSIDSTSTIDSPGIIRLLSICMIYRRYSQGKHMTWQEWQHVQLSG